ncbi:MAG: MerR family transcriptional regulator [Magnetospirillum gryphiswaldense]|nr:MerR family transcriptional regulator [Magnetospirillum gryphiswaldense]
MSEDGDSNSGRRVGKSETAFRTISEVADELDVPQHVLRFWESKFPQVKPLKRGGGRRYYRPEDVALLRRIRDLLYSEGYTIKGVQKLLREGGHKDGVAQHRHEPELQLSLPPAADKAHDTDADDSAEDDMPFELMDDGEEEEDSILAQDCGSVETPEKPGFSPRQRQELQLLLDELEQMRNLLHPRQR